MSTRGWMVTALAALAGCHTSVKPADDGDTGGECFVEDDEDRERCSPYTPYLPRKAVDILFVVDNSGSMAEEQGRLAASIDALIEPLEAANVDYRVGVTTTDNSNPWCGADTTPEAGALVLNSCRGRAEQFVFLDTNGNLPQFDVACTDHCELEPEQLDARLRPTQTQLDPEASVRPWIESGPRGTNLPDQVSGVDALRCVLPQGIVGCGFESQLESMYKAIRRSQHADEASYGFIRDEAVLAIVVLTDEADCSFDPSWDEIFSAQGSKTFWSDPDAEYPTSAVCWNAGVACSGGPGTYDECHAVDKDVDGALTDEFARSVLLPLDRYVELIQELQVRKMTYSPVADVLVAVIAGVPEGRVPGDLQGLYADAKDPVFQDDFGIGPGCTGPDGSTAVPPVRLRELEEGFGEAHLYSVCAQDYGPALENLAEDINAHMREPCFRSCVHDIDPETPGVQADCFVEESQPGGPAIEVQRCSTEDGVNVLPSPDVDTCFVLITDPSAMSEQCTEEGWNLEIELVRRPGATPIPDLTVQATCQLSESPDLDCPNLGG